MGMNHLNTVCLFILTFPHPFISTSPLKYTVQINKQKNLKMKTVWYGRHSDIGGIYLLPTIPTCTAQKQMSNNVKIKM